ncbi:MAG TPA: hypothetical protein PLO52_01480 [Flavobacterium alvei]|nr:hypothetical protein [Flavobacterium alvei]
MDNECCFIGRGLISLQEQSDTIPNPNPTRFVGNASVFNVQPQFEEKVKKDFRKATGNACQTKLISSLNLNMTVDCLKSDILALAQGGVVTDIATVAVSNESHLVNDDDDIIHFNFIAAKTGIVVTNSLGTVTYVLGTDYNLITPSADATSTVTGIIILEAGAIAAAQTILIDYTKVAQKSINPYSFVDKEYTLYFDGFNADDNSSMYVTYWRVKLGSATQIDWIGDDYIQLQFEGEMLYDDTQLAYARVLREDVA